MALVEDLDPGRFIQIAETNDDLMDLRALQAALAVRLTNVIFSP